MAASIMTISGNSTPVAKGVMRTVWAFLASAATGSIGKPLDAPVFPDKTVAVRGPWVSGVTIVLQGSNTATYTTGLTQWFQLSAASGADLSFATGKIRTILQNPRWIRPRITVRTGVQGAPTVEIISQSTRR